MRVYGIINYYTDIFSFRDGILGSDSQKGQKTNVVFWGRRTIWLILYQTKHGFYYSTILTDTLLDFLY